MAPKTYLGQGIRDISQALKLRLHRPLGECGTMGFVCGTSRTARSASPLVLAYVMEQKLPAIPSIPRTAAPPDTRMPASHSPWHCNRSARTNSHRRTFTTLIFSILYLSWLDMWSVQFLYVTRESIYKTLIKMHNENVVPFPFTSFQQTTYSIGWQQASCFIWPP